MDIHISSASLPRTNIFKNSSDFFSNSHISSSDEKDTRSPSSSVEKYWVYNYRSFILQVLLWHHWRVGAKDVIVSNPHWICKKKKFYVRIIQYLYNNLSNLTGRSHYRKYRSGNTSVFACMKLRQNRNIIENGCNTVKNEL